MRWCSQVPLFAERMLLATDGIIEWSCKKTEGEKFETGALSVSHATGLIFESTFILAAKVECADHQN
uniref:RNase H domain-containing protein n=1 Tax=Ascaris lumbricoides TaxID=6252 RepID=A0A0M3HPS7_ASCLU